MPRLRRPVTEKELRDYRRGKPVRPEVAEEAARRAGSRQAARTIRTQERRIQGGGHGISRADLNSRRYR